MFVISMAGKSSRFFDAGYTTPKYALEAFGESLFAHAIGSFSRYFGDTPFLFVTLAQFDARAFVEAECRRLGIGDARVIELEAVTRGQAETVLAGLDAAGVDDGPITIFNIDTAEPGFRHPEFVDDVDGYLDVFHGDGDRWSFARAAAPGSDRVVETAEKVRISDLCSTGLYHFASATGFREAFRAEAARLEAASRPGELYVAPLYNHLIAAGRDVRYRLVPDDGVVFFGTPDEYQALLDAGPGVFER